MKDIWATPVRPEEIAQLDARLRDTPDNLFDTDILMYPDKVKFYCARADRLLVFLPVQNVLMLESLGVEPDATELEVAKSIEVLMKFVVGKALDMGYNELYFIVKDTRVAAYAERHGFEDVMADPVRGVTLFRLKLSKLLREAVPKCEYSSAT